MTIDELAKAVTNLPPEQLDAFADWFDEFREGVWDDRIEKDARDGKLDTLAEQARAAHRAGQTKPL